MRRVRRAFAIGAIGVAVAMLGVTVADFATRHAVYRAIQRHDPRGWTSIVYENRLLPGSHLEPVRRRIGDGPLPFDRFAWIDLSSESFDDAAVAEIAVTLESAGPVGRVTLTNTAVTDAGVERLVKAAPIREFVLWYYGFAPEPRVGVTKEVARVLAASGVGELKFVGVPLGDDGAAALATSLTLRKLEVHSGELTDASLGSLATCESLTHLTVQNRGGSGVTREGAWAFRRARPEVFFRGPEIPSRIPEGEINAYRCERDRFRREKGLVP